MTIANPESPAGSDPFSGWGIIDTGAPTTCVSRNVAKLLRLRFTGTVRMNVASQSSSDSLSPIYRASVTLPMLSGANPVRVAIGLRNLDNLDIHALIGHDFLRQCSFRYDGPNWRISQLRVE